MTAKHSASDILAIGFGTTVAMWAVGYVCRLPPVSAPSELLLVLLVLCLAGGGFVAGRYSPRGARGGAVAGLLTALLNLMILGSLLTGTEPNRLVPSAIWWVPGSFLASAVIGWLGALVGTALRGSSPIEVNWIGAWTKVLAVATLLLLTIGGLVTGYGEGLSVVDWPNSFGSNMFLYPLSRMTGGIYYEHAHRLFGSLVGLTMLTLAVYLQRTEERAWLRRFAWIGLLLVIVQGILGGLRVTGHFTWSTQPADTSPSTTLAIIHGTVGQMFFATTVAIALFTSTIWRQKHAPLRRPGAVTDRALSALLIALLIVQLVLGAVLRQLSGGVLIHIAMAVIVVLATLNSALRAWGLHGEQRPLRHVGRTLALLIGLQVVLGLAAYIATGATADFPSRPAVRAAVTTVHQATGALVLVFAVLLLLWNYRLLAVAPERARHSR